MRIPFLTIFFLFVFLQKSIAQKKDLLSHPFHTSISKGSIKEFLDEINTKSGLLIEYSSNNLQLGKQIELDGTETSLGLLLKKVLQGQHVKLIERNNKILLAPSDKPIDTDALVPSYSIYGFVKENANKDPMIDATILNGQNQKFILTNTQGYYSLSLPEGDHELEVSYAGFAPKKINISLHSNTRFDFDLSPKTNMAPVTVSAADQPAESSADKISEDANEKGPRFPGESDPLRSICLLPGVLNTAANFSNMLVRGGGPDENLFLLDGIQVYNPSHFLNNLSIVNETVLKSMRLYKSDFPAKFTGSLSSVMDVYTKDGNMEQWQGEASLGVLTGGLTLEGPIVKNHTSMMASFRHSWQTPLWKQFDNNLVPDFYDLDAKLTQLVGKNDKLILNFYSGQDQINQSGNHVNNVHQWGNQLGSFRWNHLIGSKAIISAFFDYSQYHNLSAFKYSLLSETTDTVLKTRSQETFSSIGHYSAMLQGQFHISPSTQLNTGIQYRNTITKPFGAKTTAQLDESHSGFNADSAMAFDLLSGYAELEWRPGHHFIIRPGAHVFNYQYNSFNYFSIQPRLYTAYQFNQRHQLFAAYINTAQYLHLVTNPYLGLNADAWVPSTASLQPEKSESFTLGYEYRLVKRFRFSLAGYYKTLGNLINYVNGKSYFITDSTWQKNLESGSGQTYGGETMMRWSGNRFSLMVSYTLSWSWRQFPSIDNGQQIPYRYDTRHVANLAMDWQLSKHVEFAGSFSFSSGQAVLRPSNVSLRSGDDQSSSGDDNVFQNYQFIYQYADSNLYRSAGFYRMDASFRYHTLKERKWHSIITVGMYNISGAPDQYAYYLLGSSNTKTLSAQTTSVYNSFFPYVSYTLRF
ncbi:MAG: carboxypeptidase-like regulatory domain-containing protein [Bacteroidetes bacterium]|nr:carboxypeptidase-like regulatory domain-containing protein [Bacteroidota bacterium]